MQSKFIIGFLALALVLQSKAKAETQHFQKVMNVIFENTDYRPTMQQDFFAYFASQGALLSNFYADFHPSQGNYISMIAGDNFGVYGDGNVTIDQLSIVDRLEEKGLSWKVYAEGYPGDCYLGNAGQYVRKHNPFISIMNIQKNPKRCAHIVNAKQLAIDIANDEVPNYSFYAPGLDSDGHDTGVAYANDWFKMTFTPFIKEPKFMKGMLLVATFDESTFFGGNHIYTAMIGEGVVPGSESSLRYGHCSLLRMIEDNFSLASLGQRDLDATPISGIWLKP